MGTTDLPTMPELDQHLSKLKPGEATKQTTHISLIDIIPEVTFAACPPAEEEVDIRLGDARCEGIAVRVDAGAYGVARGSIRWCSHGQGGDESEERAEADDGEHCQGRIHDSSCEVDLSLLRSGLDEIVFILECWILETLTVYHLGLPHAEPL